MNKETTVSGNLRIVNYGPKGDPINDVDSLTGSNPKFKGPLSESMWLRAHKIPSAYPDTFDYGIYDRLFERFGDKQPRGSVVFKGTMKLLEAQDCQKCFHRFEIDTYGRGCVHNCSYCYAKS